MRRRWKALVMVIVHSLSLACSRLPMASITIDSESSLIRNVRFQQGLLPSGNGPVTFGAVKGPNTVSFETGNRKYKGTITVQANEDYVLRTSPPRITTSQGEVLACTEVAE
jgi:hypothetical protein